MGFTEIAPIKSLRQEETRFKFIKDSVKRDEDAIRAEC